MICRGCSNTRGIIKLEFRHKASSLNVKTTATSLKTPSSNEEVQVYPFSIKNKPVNPKEEARDIKFLMFAVDAPLSNTSNNYEFISDFVLNIKHLEGNVDIDPPTVEKARVTRLTGKDNNKVDYETTDFIYEYNSNRPSHQGITHLIVLSKNNYIVIPSTIPKVIVDSTETENVWGIKKAGKKK